MEAALSAYEITEWIAFYQIENEDAERRRLEHIAQVAAHADLQSRPTTR